MASPPVLVLILAGVMSIGIASIGWKFRSEFIGKWFIGMTLSAGLWSLFEAAFLLSHSRPTLTAWYILIWITYEFTIFFTALFVFEIAGYEQWVSRRTAVLFGVWPAFTIVGAVTNGLGVHSLIWRSFSVTVFAGGTLRDVSYGPWFWADLTYALLVIGLLISLLGIHTVRSSQIYRKQALVLLVGIAIPAVVEVVYLLVPFWPTTPVPISFAATSVLFAIGLSRYRILDIVPIARHLVIERMADPVLVVDRQDRLVDLNPAARALFSVSPSVVGSSVREALGSETARALCDGRELRVTDQHDEPHHFEVDTATVTDGRGIVRGTLYILHDITERRVRERWFRALTENASDLIFVTDADGSISYMSDSARQTLRVGTDASEPETLYDYLHPADCDLARETFERVREQPTADTTVELRFHSAAHGWRAFSVRCRNLLDDSVVGGVVVNAHDIAERKKHEQQLEEFASVVSHDLRNPLNVANGFLDIVKESEGEPNPEDIERIERAHERMNEIITDVLAVARGSKKVEALESVSLDTVASAAWTNVDTKSGSLEVVGDASFEADRTRLLQLLENLFRNAVEHGGDGVTVTVGATADGFYVEDDGPGVPPETRPRLFESGYTTTTNGTGFGLAIVRAVAEAHDWTVAYEDGQTGGARFVVRGVQSLPRPVREPNASSPDEP
ncbi:histidine kinase N-terminal 7TM domain-containing protein [Haloferax sp. Q22]|uniref:histidine kinase N-terminal 7TM domain-containing protein n=1 Tax=Haloferax sp. (strain Q22) TaxID=1526048 RepID=UPI00373FC788